MGRNTSEVKLEVTSTRKFQDIALLVDRTDFQKDITKIKSYLKKVKLSAQSSSDKLRQYLEYPVESAREIRKLLAKYKYPYGFTDAIRELVDERRISDKSLHDCYSKVHIEIVNVDFLPQVAINPNEIAITVYPYAIKGKTKLMLNDIKKALNQAVALIRPLSSKHPLNLSAQTSIRQQRKLYWKYKLEGKGYQKLSKELGMNQETLRSSINSYSNLLTISL